MGKLLGRGSRITRMGQDYADSPGVSPGRGCADMDYMDGAADGLLAARPYLEQLKRKSRPGF